MPALNARSAKRKRDSAQPQKMTPPTEAVLELQRRFIWMFVNDWFSSVLLLSFAGLLCLFGVGILIDGIIRLSGEWHRRNRAVVDNGKEHEEKPSPHEHAA